MTLREEYFDALNSHASGSDPALILVGEAGSGKSSMLDDWALRYGRTHPEAAVIFHSTEASPLAPTSP